MDITELYQNLFGKGHLKDGDVIDMSEHGRVGGVSTGQGYKFVNDVSKMGLLPFDYVAMVISPADTETYTFKSGGSGGTTTNTVVIVYTDSTRADISTVTKT